MKTTNLRRSHARVSIAVIGKGRVGRSLAAAIRSDDRQLKLFSHLSARERSFSALEKTGGPDVVFVVCSDRYVPSVARRVLAACGPNTRLIVHCAGSLPSSVLPQRDAVSRLMLHPMQTFGVASANVFDGISFAYETDDRQGARFALLFARSIGGASAIRLRADQLPLYHATVMIAANFITLLGGALESLAKDLSMTPDELKKAVDPLMTTSLGNVLKAASKDVLTGPIARGDVNTMRKHRAALRKSGHSELLRLYDAFVALARELY